MDFARSFINNGQTSTSALPFNIQLPRFDLNSISETLSHTNFMPPHFDSFMGNSSRQSSREEGCVGCGNKFNLLKRKKICFDCKADFCSSCLIRDSGKNHCNRCLVFSQVPLDRNALMGLKVRDLNWFLSSKNISGHFCKEKSELVDLILQLENGCNPGNNYRTDQHPQSGFPQNHQQPNSFNHENINQPSQGQSSMNHGHSENIFPNFDGAANTNSSFNVQSQVNQSNETHNNQATNDSNESNENEDFKPFNIEDLTSPEQIQDLSVMQLKLLLTRNFVNYKGCVEKEELIEKAKRLWANLQENKKQNADEISDANICKICMENVIDCVLLECGHMVACTHCGKRLNECPICRQYVVRVIRTFKS